jgi:hypothetical protein
LPGEIRRIVSFCRQLKKFLRLLARGFRPFRHSLKLGDLVRRRLNRERVIEIRQA